MTRIYLADARPEERSALRLLVLDLMMDVVGEASDWATTVAQVPSSDTDLLLVDWKLLPDAPRPALEKLRQACPAALVVILLSPLEANEPATLAAGADAFISRGESPDSVADHLREFARSIPVYPIAMDAWEESFSGLAA